MGGAFDPYHRWLGISPKDQPPNHYRLLGLERFESDHDVIDEAADRQMRHVRTHQSGQYGELSQKLLNEISSARRCLLNDVMRHDYDAKLRALEPSPVKTAQPLEAMPLEAKPLPVAQPLDAEPIQRAVPLEESSIPSSVVAREVPAAQPQAEVPAFVSPGPRSNVHTRSRRPKRNPLLPVLIVAGGGGLLILVALGVLASALLVTDPEVASNHNPPEISRPPGNSVVSSNPLPRPSEDPFGFQDAETSFPPPTEVERTTVPPIASPFPEIDGEPRTLDAHPVPLGEFVTAQDLPQHVAEPIVEKVKYATVTLQLPSGRSTSAFVVDRRGWAITNYSFLAGSPSATIALGRLSTQRVEGVVAANPRCDLALIDIGPLHEATTVAQLAAKPWPEREIVLSSAAPDVANHYVSIGQAFGPMSGSLVRKTMETEEGFDLFGRRGYGEETNWVRVTVNSSQGRLGAPIIDTQSRVIGVTTWVSSRDPDIACAVSVDEIHNLLSSIDGKSYPLSVLDGESVIPPR